MCARLDPKAAYLVTVDHGEVTDLTALEMDVVRWSVLDVDVIPAGGIDDIVDLIRRAVAQGAEEAAGRLLACRILLQGRTELHNRLVTDAEELTAEARSVALGLGEEVAWVEQVAVRTTPVADAALLEAREDTLGDLQRMLQDAGADKELLTQLQEDIEKLVRRLPHDLTENAKYEVLATAIAGDFPGLIEQVTPYLNARLMVEYD